MSSSWRFAGRISPRYESKLDGDDESGGPMPEPVRLCSVDGRQGTFLIITQSLLSSRMCETVFGKFVSRVAGSTLVPNFIPNSVVSHAIFFYFWSVIYFALYI